MVDARAPRILHKTSLPAVRVNVRCSLEVGARELADTVYYVMLCPTLLPPRAAAAADLAVHIARACHWDLLCFCEPTFCLAHALMAARADSSSSSHSLGPSPSASGPFRRGPLCFS